MADTGIGIPIKVESPLCFALKRARRIRPLMLKMSAINKAADPNVSE